MFKKISVGILVLSSLAFGDVYTLKPIKITKDISCVIGDLNPPTKENNGFVSNMCYVNIGDSLVVLDAGPTYKFAKEFYTFMKKEYPKLEVSHVVLSNFHDDRVQGASFFKDLGAKIVGYTNYNQDMKDNIDKFDRMKMILPSNILEGTKLIEADTLVENGYEIKGSKKTLTILKPSKVSEEKSDIAIYSKEDSFLFVGNMVFNGRMINYTKNSDIDGWIEALEKLSHLNAKYLLGGHGKEYYKDSYKASLEYLKILRADVKNGYEAGLDSTQIVSLVKTDKFSHLSYYTQLNYGNIQNYYNQLEWK
ncbi:MAG: MBL fold metallo-hydrolase [Arcobacteraceae bacterium]|jgi:glyoxylase-like metal-dependent hydrolase (beta-lactamase superfamily II)|nr:MBL fold metallo-hydrolase [Arcobacteraceae bacterium]